MNKSKLLIKQLAEANQRLTEALKVDIKQNELALDAIIQRFEFTFELSWKFLKAYLSEKGIDVNSPKDTLKEAFKNNYIDNEDKWLALLKARNLTSHTYNEKEAFNVYQEIKKNNAIFTELVNGFL